ncbi:MAG: FliG C-terminal domain-containing protein [Pseudomonadota bacterium]
MTDTATNVPAATTHPVPALSPLPVNEPSPVDKAAVIIAALGAEQASAFLADLPEPLLRKVARAISRLRRVPIALLQQIVEDFLAELERDTGVYGGSEEARKLLSAVVDEKTVKRIMSDVDGNVRRSIWDQLGACSEVAVARFLQAEHPQTAAVILSELRPDKAAGILERLDEEMARITVLRLSRVPQLDDEVMALIEDVIVRDFLSALQQEMATVKPADLIGGLMNNVSTTSREKLLRHLEEKKPEFAREVLKVMFTFADIELRVEPRDVSAVIRGVEEPVLMAALKSADSAGISSVSFILNNISKRLSERYREELAAMPDVKPKEGDQAQAQVIAAIQQLAKSGEIKLNDGD